MLHRLGAPIVLVLAVVFGAGAAEVCRAQPAVAGRLAMVDADTAGAFPLVAAHQAAPLYVDPADAAVVRIAADAFARDIERVTGVLPEVREAAQATAPHAVIVGTLGHSALIDRLAASGRLRVDGLRDAWESFTVAVVEHPFEGVTQALVVAGSDRRGTAYGVFTLSRRMGVSPWVWWADVAPEPREALFVTPGMLHEGPPSVQYRGIFINDEDWGLQPWAARHLDTDIRDIGPQTYARVFELLLRLKANYLWPAMHPSTKAFYHYPDNPKVADRYAIVVGSSHAEPMLRNNVFEWRDHFETEYGEPPGPWRYDENRAQIYRYWDDRVRQSAPYESIYTVGMRGIHDSGMPGPKAQDERIALLQQVIADQRHMLSADLGRLAHTIPQIFCPYKEVLALYQGGLELPDDVTIVWADDNHGYIRQLSTPAEQQRAGGSGVYYHLSYWGAPQDYLWLSTTSPALIAFEMAKAYRYGARRLWVFNVGDIKPAEMALQFAMDLAWDVEAWPPERAHEYAAAWAAETFGADFARPIAAIKRTYYRLAQAARPEHLGAVTFSPHEADARLRDYAALAEQAESLRPRIPARLQDAYFELILYPVEGARRMNEKILYARKSLNLARQGDTTALAFARKARAAFDRIQALTDVYNDEIADGKWSGIMSWHPRDLAVFDMPEAATPEQVIAGSTAATTPSAGTSPPFPHAAADYTRRDDGDTAHVEIIKGLGRGGAGITVMPLNAPSIDAADVAQAASVTYDVTLDAGEHVVVVRALPGHRIHAGRALRYAVSIDGAPPQVVDLDAPSESPAWAENVLRGYAEGRTTHRITTPGIHHLRLYLLDPGLVINEVEAR